MNNKFVSLIAGSAEGIKLKRAQATAQAAKLAQESLINTLSQNLQRLDARLTSILDIGPESGDSLRPVAKDFNAEAWVSNVQELKLAQAKAEEQLETAKNTYYEWFGEPVAVTGRAGVTEAQN